MRRCVPFILVLAALAGAPGSAAASTQFRPRVVGGVPAAQPFPAQAFVRADGDLVRQTCGATLLSSRWLLTAGHCISDFNTQALLAPERITVSLGDSRSNGPGMVQYAVSTVIRHENYVENADRIPDNDLALLELQTPVPNALEPLRLSNYTKQSDTDLWRPGALAAVIGWGSTIPGQNSPSVDLLQATVPIVSDAYTSAAYDGPSGTPFRSSTMVGAGDGRTDTCQGDSGGPLMVARGDVFMAVGITSWGYGCADPAHPGVYTRIGAPALNGWIRDRVPFATINVLPDPVQPGDNVTLTATRTNGAHGSGPSSTWDTNGDGIFADGAGSTATISNIAAGNHVVRVRSTYSDGDVSTAREVITTAGTTPPPPPPMAPFPAPPVRPPDPVTVPPPPPPPPPPPKPDPRVATVAFPAHITVRSLRDGRLSLAVRCFAACRLASQMNLDGKTAGRLGLTRGHTAVRLASGSARHPKAGHYRLSLHLLRAAVIGLRPARSGTLRLFVVASGATRREVHRHTVRLSP